METYRINAEIIERMEATETVEIISRAVNETSRTMPPDISDEPQRRVAEFGNLS